jgi:hypothetical protein
VVGSNVFPFGIEKEELEIQGWGFLLETEETPPWGLCKYGVRHKIASNKRRPQKGPNMNTSLKAAQGNLTTLPECPF